MKILLRFLVDVALGAAGFALLHTYLVTHWSAFGGQHEPWFLNSGDALWFMLRGLFLLALVVGFSVRRWPTVWRTFIGVVVGVGIAMTTVLFTIGPGNIWPIVLVTGGWWTGIAIAVGLMIGWSIHQGVQQLRAQ
jgi:hypothetical protein